jgi:peptidoglycan hydrolase CwlO-like protein
MNNDTTEKQRGWLKKLFDRKKIQEDYAPVEMSQNNPDNRREGETYTQWGTRICGVVGGNMAALPPYLQKVYHYIYNEQAHNIKLQEEAQANTQTEIERKREEVGFINDKINNANSSIEKTKEKIKELKEERQEIKQGKERVNKEQRLKLVIGLIILIPLTFYLFLFYSSTFFSAFFRQPETMTDVMNAMFDSNALATASEAGLTELGFVLSAPIIFLGLGFSLHFFSIQEGRMKYLKMLAILIVTVMFDCILAYKIGDQMHTVGIMIGQFPIGEEYTASMAFHDINTWAVIFCGFIVYVIWGIVFDMCMSAYNKMDLNKTRLENIKKEIEEQEQLISSENDSIQKLKQEKLDTEDAIKKLMAKLGHEVYIDYGAIRTELTNFFTGWITMMKVLSLDQSKLDEASATYKHEIETLIPN